MATENKSNGEISPEQAIGKFASSRDISMWIRRSLSSKFPGREGIEMMFEGRIDNNPPFFSEPKTADFSHEKVPTVMKHFDEAFDRARPTMLQFHNEATFKSLADSVINKVIETELRLLDSAHIIEE